MALACVVSSLPLVGVTPVGVPAAGPVLPGPGGLVATLLGGSLLATLGSLLTAAARVFASGVALPVVRFVLHTPALAAEPGLRALWWTSLGIQAVVSVLLVALAGLRLTAGPASGVGGTAEARDALVRRLPVGFATSLLALPLVGVEITLSNTLVDAVLPHPLTGVQALLGAAGLGTGGGASTGVGTTGLAAVVTAVVLVVILVALTVTALARIAALWVLTGLVPVVMTAGLLPGGERAIRLWWRAQFAALALPVAQAALLAAYLDLSHTAGLTGLVGALAGIAVAEAMARLPHLVTDTVITLDVAAVGRWGRTTVRTATTLTRATSPPG